MYSWVWASTPVVARTSTRGRMRSSSASDAEPVDLGEGVDDDPAHPGRQAQPELLDALVVAVQTDLTQIHPGPLHHRELAPGADVDAQTLLGHPAGDGGAEERLAGVVHIQPLNASAKARARARRSASSTTYAGVPTWSASSVTLIPATRSTPSSSLSTPALHSRGSSAFTSPGRLNQPGARAVASAWIEPATWVWVTTLTVPAASRRGPGRFPSAGHCQAQRAVISHRCVDLGQLQRRPVTSPARRRP